MSLTLFFFIFVLLAQEVEPPPAGMDEPAPTELRISDPAAQAAFEARLAGVREKLERVKDLRADFVQQKQTALLKSPIASSGSLTSKGARVLWQTRKPRPMGMLVCESEVRIHYPDDKLLEIYPIGSGFREATGGPLPRLEQLRERFDFVELDTQVLSSAPDCSHLVALRLTPRSDELKKHVAWVHVLIDESIPCANRIVIADPDGDETDLRFSNVRINSGVTDAEVELTLPGGVRISRPISGTQSQENDPTSSKPPPARHEPE